MATIALYAAKMNQMPGLIQEVKRTVTDYQEELFALKKKTLTINKSICNMEDVISSIQASSQTQEQKNDSLDQFKRNCGDFIADAVRMDGNVADVINKRKQDFYNKYNYLKPECEKNGWEKFKEGCKKAGEWCKEHWKAIATVIIVIGAVLLICTGIGGILGAIAFGALLGAAIGGVTGGIISAMMGGSFWEGFENGAFAGAIGGMIAGGMGFVMGAGGIALSFGKTMMIGAVSGSGGSLINDIGAIMIEGVELSIGEVLLNMTISGVFGAAFAGIGYGLSKGIASLKLKFGTIKGGSSSHDIVQYEKLKSSYAADEIINGERIGSGLKPDPYHRAASFIPEGQLAQGRTFTFTNGDGRNMTMLQTEGNLNGITGIYEYILNPKGQIEHQLFKPGAGIIGPN